MANITAHMLPSGDGEKKVDDPTNDPRPFFRHNRAKQLNHQPTFHTKRKSDKCTLGQNRATRTPLSVRPHPGRHVAPPRTDAHGSKRQTGRLDVHKAPGRSQLSKYGTGALGPNDLTRTDDLTRHDQTTRPERTPSPGATRRAHPNGRHRAERTNDPTRTDALTRHDRTTRPERTPSPGTTERPDPNGRT